MGKRYANPNLAKIHRNYSVRDVCELYGVHPNTVRTWIRQGLPTIDERRPLLVHGSDLRTFLRARRTRRKRPCRPGEIYCVGCRKPQRPDGNMADYEPTNDTTGNLVGLCPQCENLIYRRVSLGKLTAVRGDLEVTLPQALRDLG